MSRFLVAVFMGFVVITCQKKTAVWILPGSTASQVRFGLGEVANQERDGYVRTLLIQRCGTYGDSALALWAVGSFNGLPGQITYGDVPINASERSPARPITPGLFVAITEGSGAAHFMVDSLGAVRSIESCYASQRSINRLYHRPPPNVTTIPQTLARIGLSAP